MILLDLAEDPICEIISHLDAISITYFLNSSKQLQTFTHKKLIIDRIVPYQRFIKIRHWNAGLLKAASKNNIPQVEYFISKGADGINLALCEAAQLGNQRLVKLLIEHGACRWNEGLRFAALGGHKYLVDFFIQKGAQHWEKGFFSFLIICKAKLWNPLEHVLIKRCV